MSVSDMERSWCSMSVSSLPHRLPSLWDSFQHTPSAPCHGYSCVEIQNDLLKVTLQALLKGILSSGLYEETQWGSSSCILCYTHTTGYSVAKVNIWIATVAKMMLKDF